MHDPPQLHPMEEALAERLPGLRPPQRRGLALWVLGAILARSACQSAVLAALLPWAPYHALRQRLREWLRDGADKATPCAAQVEIETCFAPLLRWVLAWWRGRELALAIDATAHGERLVALVVSVLYRGTAIPVAWAILPGNTAGPWLGPILRLLRLLRPALPACWTVLVLADRGLWSPRLWKRVRDLGWHPLLRIQRRTTVAPDGRERCRAEALVRPGEAWVGRGRLGSPKGRRLGVTLVAVWTPGQEEPWVVVTDLPPERVGVSWYALRTWVELAFKRLKSLLGLGELPARSPDLARAWLSAKLILALLAEDAAGGLAAALSPSGGRPRRLALAAHPRRAAEPHRRHPRAVAAALLARARGAAVAHPGRAAATTGEPSR